MPKTILRRRKAAPKKPNPDPALISGIRATLFEAQAIANCVRHAVTTCDNGLTETDQTFSLAVASRLIDNACEQLDPFETRAHGRVRAGVTAPR
jgi:hypothetical protein